VLSNDAVGDEFFSVLVQYDLLTVDLLVHDGLCKHRLVVLVMSVTSIAHLYTLPVKSLTYMTSH